MIYLFVYDAFCFPYYLEYQIGDVTTLGLAMLSNRKSYF